MQFNCPDCGEPFATIAKLGLHRHIVHGAPTLNAKYQVYESPPTVSCPFCGQTYLLSLKAFPRYTETKDYLRLVVDCFECECGATYAREYDE